MDSQARGREEDVPRTAKLEAAIAALQVQPSPQRDSVDQSLGPPLLTIQAVSENTLNPVPAPVRSSSPPIAIDVVWRELPSIPTSNPHNTFMTTAAAIRGQIYLFGGFRSRRVSVFDTVVERWSTGDSVGDELGVIRPIGSASVIAPVQVVSLEECRSPRGAERNTIKVIPRIRK